MSLTSALKKAGPDLDVEDKAAIISRSRELRAEGQSVADAARASVDERIAYVQNELAGSADPSVSDTVAQD